MPRIPKTKLRLGGGAAVGLAAAGLALAAVPALAQPASPSTVEQLTVTGEYGPFGPQRLSQVVYFGDLDLATAAGRSALEHRIRTTAHDLCLRLGEQPNVTAPPLLQSCEQQAVNSARDAERTAVAMARPGGLYAYAEPPPAYDEAAPVPPPAPAAPAAGSYGQEASYTTQTVTNGPVPDTPENRARFGGPMSHAGRVTRPAGN
jgi:UrcA family protein